MQETLITIIVPLTIGIIPALISYAVARHQANNALQLAKEQQKAELEKLKEQQKAEMSRFAEQQKAEIEKLREQSKLELERLNIEIDKQAELYERNAQIDVTKDVFGKMLGGDLNVFENLMNMDKVIKEMEKGKSKNESYPIKKRK
ncbi:hypothetical protein LG326_03465 [Metaplanococcus flavidus]